MHLVRAVLERSIFLQFALISHDCRCPDTIAFRCESCNRYSMVTCRLTSALTAFHNGLVILEAQRQDRNAALNRDPALLLSTPFTSIRGR